MKNRIFSLLLGGVMLTAALFTGCAGGSENPSDTSADTTADDGMISVKASFSLEGESEPLLDTTLELEDDTTLLRLLNRVKAEHDVDIKVANLETIVDFYGYTESYDRFFNKNSWVGALNGEPISEKFSKIKLSDGDELAFEYRYEPESSYELSNTLYRLKKDKKLTIGYFGGSITAGAGSSSADKCWRSLTTAYFKKNYPDCEIREINAAIGGTGSQMGILRCEYDLTKYKPDLVFVEYSVNDAGWKEDDIRSYSESIVRKIYEANPTAEIVFVHSITKAMAEDATKLSGKRAHTSVMLHYGIPQVDCGIPMTEAVKSAGGDWKSYTTDNVHPNDKGYAIYAETIAELLELKLSGETPDKLTERELPEQIGALDFTGAHMIDAKQAVGDWEYVDKRYIGLHPDYIESSNPGDSFTFKFKGANILAYAKVTTDGGSITYSIDGGAEKTTSFYNSYANITARSLATYLDPDVEHTLTVRVADTHHEKSTGDRVSIAAFMIY